MAAAAKGWMFATAAAAKGWIFAAAAAAKGWMFAAEAAPAEASEVESVCARLLAAAAAAKGWMFAAEAAPAETSEVERVRARLLAAAAAASAILVVGLFLVGRDGGGEGRAEMVEKQSGSGFSWRVQRVVCGGEERRWKVFQPRRGVGPVWTWV
jgi:hypothetical protein